MLRDASDIPHGSVVRADVCVVGAGAAGIALSTALAGSRRTVVVLESGGLDEEPGPQRLNAGDLAGVPYFELDETRYRRFGGSTHRWAGWCRPLDPIDFERRPWVAGSGWPLTAAALAPYYRRAAAICQLPGAAFDPGDWGNAVPPPYRPQVGAGDVRTVVYLGSPPTKFGDVFRADLAGAGNVTVYLHATAIELETAPPGKRVDGVLAGSLDGRRFRVEASTYVLTAGALETARLLLASRGAHPAGIGNHHDLVGRYFGDHPHVLTGVLHLWRPRQSGRAEMASIDRGWSGARARLRLRRPADGVKFGYALTAAAQREHGLLNHSTHLVPLAGVDAGAEWYRSLALVAANLRSPRRVVRQVRAGSLPEGWGRHVRTIAAHPARVASAALKEVARRPRRLGLYTQAEQAPNPASRVTLSDRRDPFGVPRLRLDWRFTPAEQPSIVAMHDVLGAQLERAGIGRVEPAAWLGGDPDAWGEGMSGGHHQLGTARMSADPRHGVVDADGRVHGVGNLLIADGAVFPTIGSANPLLTIVALALRTADRLRR